MACFAKKVNQIIKKRLVRSIFLPDKHALYSADQQITKMFFRWKFGRSYRAIGFSCRIALWGSPKRSQRPQSFLHGPSVAGIMLISPLTNGVGG